MKTMKSARLLPHAGAALLCAATVLAAAHAMATDVGEALTPGAVLVFTGARATPVGQVPERFQRASMMALLNNLLDDGDPPRFVDPRSPTVCGEQTSVLLHGVPVRAGDEVPAGAFELDWTLQGACPLGPDGPRLHGKLRMLVVRDDSAGLAPVPVAAR